jgi:hypothetical protein
MKNGSAFARLVLAAAFLCTAAPLIAAADPADPAPPPAADGFAQPVKGISVYGDFAEAGNSVLRCPTAAEPAYLGGSADSCDRASNRQRPVVPLLPGGSNNDYYMRFAEQPGAFDGSTASLTVPAGATVQYAQLDWGGNTGVYKGLGARFCTWPFPLLTRPADVPPAPAAADARDQQVSLAVGSAAPSAVPLETVQAHYASSSSVATPAEMYSSWADVTSSFSGTTDGRPIPVTVSNVWAASGFGCSAGWSLTVVFSDPAQYPTLRQVDVYTGHSHQDFASATETLTGLSANPAAANVKMGITAYDGDWNNSTDQLLVAGQPVASPCDTTSATDNFLSSCATGAQVPDNLSVDATTFTPNVPAGTPAAVPVELRAGSDLFLLQGLTLAEDIHPAFTTQVTLPSKPVHAGGTLEFLVSGSNTGDIPLTGLVLTDQKAADCAQKTLGDLAPGQAYSVTCHATGLEQPSLADSVKVAATWPHDDLGLTVTNTVPFTEPVAGPQLAVTAAVTPATVRSGDTATVTFTVANQGTAADGPLSAATVTAAGLPGCTPAPVPTVEAGQSATTTCTVKLDKTASSAATATAKDSSGADVTATSPEVAVTVIHPALTITATTDPAQIAPGKTTHFTVTVHNTGDVALTVAVSNSTATDCDFTSTGPGLAPGVARSQKCEVTAPSTLGPLTDTAKFTANPVGDPDTSRPLTGSALGTATVTTTPTTTGGSSGGDTGTVGGQSGGTGSTKTGGTGGSSGTNQASGSQPGLAYTGVSIALPITVGVALLAGGVVLLIASRRRRRT